MSATDPRVAAIEALGYTPREAAFLACVTRQGGYFLRRQFLAWMGCTPGRAVVAFTQHLLARRHATRQTFCRQTHVYHLASRVLYEGAPTSTPRDRQRRSGLVIKTRLMAVDLAMAHRNVVFLATEQERVDYCDRLGVDRARLPQQVVRPYRPSTPQVHYFPHPARLGLRDADGPAPTVLCAYVDDGETGATASAPSPTLSTPVGGVATLAGGVRRRTVASDCGRVSGVCARVRRGCGLGRRARPGGTRRVLPAPAAL